MGAGWLADVRGTSAPLPRNTTMMRTRCPFRSALSSSTPEGEQNTRHRERPQQGDCLALPRPPLRVLDAFNLLGETLFVLPRINHCFGGIKERHNAHRDLHRMLAHPPDTPSESPTAASVSECLASDIVGGAGTYEVRMMPSGGLGGPLSERSSGARRCGRKSSSVMERTRKLRTRASVVDWKRSLMRSCSLGYHWRPCTPPVSVAA